MDELVGAVRCREPTTNTLDTRHDGPDVSTLAPDAGLLCPQHSSQLLYPPRERVARAKREAVSSSMMDGAGTRRDRRQSGGPYIYVCLGLSCYNPDAPLTIHSQGFLWTPVKVLATGTLPNTLSQTLHIQRTQEGELTTQPSTSVRQSFETTIKNICLSH